MKIHEAIVVGSGLSAIGAIKGLVERGLKPLVLDIGIRLPEDARKIQSELSKKDPAEWSPDQRDKLSFNPSNTKSLFSIPKKLNFGSDYFYAKPTKESPINAIKIFPPLSFAMGGLAEGWGSASMPPARSDVKDWPVSYEELIHYYKLSISSEFFSGSVDQLASEFPILHPDPKTSELSNYDNYLLEKLTKITSNSEDILCGRARLLLNLDSSSSKHCRNCGECMSGCVFGSIYKPSFEIQTLRRSKEN